MNPVEQLMLMSKLAEGLKTPQEFHLTHITGLSIREWVSKAPYNPFFSMKGGQYLYKGIPFVEDETIPPGDVYLMGPGGII